MIYKLPAPITARNRPASTNGAITVGSLCHRNGHVFPSGTGILMYVTVRGLRLRAPLNRCTPNGHSRPLVAPGATRKYL